MQSTRRPLPSALPVAKVKGSGSSRRLRPLRLHLLSLCPCPELVIAATIAPATPRTADCSHRDRTGSDLRRPTSSPAAPQRIDSRTGSTQHLTMVLSLSLSPGAVGHPTVRPALAYQQNTGALKSPLPLNRALPLPFAARGGVPNRAPMPPPRAPSLFLAPKKETHPGRLNFKKRFLPQELAPNVPWR